MLILHASEDEGFLHVWGESPPREAPPAPHRGRKTGTTASTKAGAKALSPFDPGAPALAEVLRPFSEEKEPASLAWTVTAWLPTVAGQPLASHPLIAEPAASGGVAAPAGDGAALAPWTVTAMPLAAGEMLALLTACQEQDTLGPGVRIGATLAFWARALRLAAALVVRQQIVPDVEKTADGYVARWRPVRVGPDAEAFAALARTMPGACRALSEDAAAPPDTPAAIVLERVLTRLCDHLARPTPAPVSRTPEPPRRGRKPKPPAFDSLHAQWLHALQTPEGTLAGDPSELAALAKTVRAWRRPLFLSLAAPFRLCFRLEEPSAPDDESWRVRLLLQSAADPSLLIPVENAWDTRRKEAAPLRAPGFDPREFLLTALGQAAHVCPEIEESLQAPRPAGFSLSLAGAHTFLTERAWLLEQSGFGVHLPAWWTRKGTKQRLTARAIVKGPKMQGGGALSLESLIEFDWEAALGGEPLSRNELEALARQKTPLVRVRGQWVQLDAGEIEAALAFWKKKGESPATVRDLLRMEIGAVRAPGGLEIEAVEAGEAAGTIGQMLARLRGQAALAPAPVPKGFCGALRPYQQRGYEWLRFLSGLGLGACLADDMGLGKTAQTIALAAARRTEPGNDAAARPILVICPTSVLGNWQHEIARFAPFLSVLVHHGPERLRGDALSEAAERHAVVLTSFALLARDVEMLRRIPWAGMVLDEAQNIKNPETRQSRAARALSVPWRVALTGTPVENHVGDLWAISEFLNPGFLGSERDFKRAFFTPIQIERDPDAVRRLQRLTGPFLLRRVKTDRAIISDLPDKIEIPEYCTLTAEQVSLYEAVVRDAEEQIEEAEGMQRRGLVLATLSKLKQVCNHPAQFLGDNSRIAGRSGKLARLTELIEEILAAGDKALVFTQFAEMGGLLKRHLQEAFGREVLFLHGGVAKKERDRMVARFQSEESLPVFLLSLKAGGVGLNLTAARHVIHFDRWWNPAVENQATDRAFRIGQTKNVQVRKFVCSGTLEERIAAMIEGKKEIAEGVVGTGEAWLTELSTTDLKNLFALRRDAALGDAALGEDTHREEAT